MAQHIYTYVYIMKQKFIKQYLLFISNALWVIYTRVSQSH